MGAACEHWCLSALLRHLRRWIWIPLPVVRRANEPRGIVEGTYTVQPYVTLSRPVREGSQVSIALEVHPSLAKYFRQRVFRVRYGTEVDLAKIPDGILAIPAVGNVIT